MIEVAVPPVAPVAPDGVVTEHSATAAGVLAVGASPTTCLRGMSARPEQGTPAPTSFAATPRTFAMPDLRQPKVSFLSHRRTSVSPPRAFANDFAVAGSSACTLHAMPFVLFTHANGGRSAPVAAARAQSPVVRSSTNRSRSLVLENVAHSMVSGSRSQSAMAVGAMRQSYRWRVVSSACGDRKLIGAHSLPVARTVLAINWSIFAFPAADHAFGIGSIAFESPLLAPPHAARPTARSVTNASVVVRIRRTVPPRIDRVRARSVTPPPGPAVAAAPPRMGAILPVMRHRMLPSITAIAIACAGLLATVPPAGAAPTGTADATGTTGPTGPTALLHVQPTGKYVTVAQGTAPVGKGSTAWKFRRAPGQLGTTCWLWVSKPKPRTLRYNGTDGSLCAPPVPADADPVDVPQFLAQSTKGSPYGLLAVKVPSTTTNVKVGFAGGRVVPAKVARNGLITWAGKQLPIYVSMRLGGRTPLECASGGVMTRADLSDPQLTHNALGTPFTCPEP